MEHEKKNLLAFVACNGAPSGLNEINEFGTKRTRNDQK